MKQRYFFILLFLVGLLIGGVYFSDFLRTQHPVFGSINGKLILFILLAVIVQLMAHLLRANKSKLLIDGIRPAKTRTLFKGLSVGYLFNTLLPLRLGELVRAFYVGDALSISKTAVFISIIIERIVDGLILGICFISAGIILKSASDDDFGHLLHFGLGLIIISSALAMLIYAVRSEKKFVLRLTHSTSVIFNEGIANRLRFISWSGIYGTKLMLSDRRVLRRYLLLSLAMWLLYFASTAFVAIAYFQCIGANKLWFATQATYAGVSAPAGPGYIGTFQIIVSRLLENIGLARAGGFALIMWLVLVTPISVIGVVVLLRQKFSEKKPSVKQQMLINKLYREGDVSEELGHFLEAYFKGEEINRILTQAELEDKFKLIKSFRGGSNAHTMLVWQGGKNRVKKLALLQFSDKLEEQAQWLMARERLKHIPKVIDQEKTDNYYYYDLSYKKEYRPLFDFIHSQSSSKSYAVLRDVLTFMDQSIYYEVPVRNGRQKLNTYIEEKVLGKVNDTASMSNPINKLMGYEKLLINGVRQQNILQAIDKIKKNKRAMADLSSYKESPIHGDLTVDNLIVNKAGDFLVLDPNNENQVSSKIVDIAKLYQSLNSGYEFLIELKGCRVVGNEINFEDARSQKYAEIFERFRAKLTEELDPSDYRTILFHEAVHFCRMLTYRVNLNADTAPVFYATAVKLFNEFLAQYDK